MVKLDKKLFWDVNFRQLDYQKNADFIIGRVLQWGDLDDFRKIKRVYKLNRIKKVASRLSYSDKKNQNFWCFILNLKNRNICMQRSLQRKHSNFLNR